MSIESELILLGQDKTAIANAITAKGGTVNQGDGFHTFAADIATIPTGATEAESVNKFFRKQITSFDKDFFTGMTAIPDYLFFQYAPSEGIDLDLRGTNITTIAQQAFFNAKFESINFGEKLTTISNSAFIYASYVNPSTFTIVFPETLQSIGTNAIAATYGVTYIFRGQNPPTIASNSLRSPAYTDFTIYVPYGYKNTYINSSTEWAAYEARIQELPQGE